MRSFHVDKLTHKARQQKQFTWQQQRKFERSFAPLSLYRTVCLLTACFDTAAAERAPSLPADQ